MDSTRPTLTVRHSTWAGAAAGTFAGAAPGTLLLALAGIGDGASGQIHMELQLILIGVTFALPAGTLAGVLVGAFYKVNPHFPRSNQLQSMVLGGAAGVASILVVALAQSDSSGSGFVLILWPFGIGLGAFGGILWHRFITDERAIRIGRIIKIPMIAFLGWSLAWAKYGYDPEGPKYVQVAGEVRHYNTYHESSAPGPPVGYYIQCSDFATRVYLPDEAAVFLGQEIRARGLASERCEHSNFNCYLAVDTDIEGSYLEPYRGFSREERVNKARESEATPTPTAEPSASDETEAAEPETSP